MMDAGKLWQERFRAEERRRLRYLRYMFNDHLLVGLFIVLGWAAVVYKRSIEQLPLISVPSHRCGGVWLGGGVRLGAHLVS